VDKIITLMPYNFKNLASPLDHIGMLVSWTDPACVGYYSWIIQNVTTVL